MEYLSNSRHYGRVRPARGPVVPVIISSQGVRTMKELTLQRSYNRKDFGITNLRRSEYVVNGELYTFFTLQGSGYTNKWDGKDFIYQCRDSFGVMEPGKKSTIRRHVFVREIPYGPYTYYGKAQYEERFSDTENRIVP
jgi:hypothetical protein